MQFKSFMEALRGKQHKIDKNKNGDIDAQDFKLLRKEEEELEESEERMSRSDYKVSPSGRKSHKEIVFNDAESKDDKEEMKEAKMSDADMAERERIVKGMKKNLAGFKARYGDRAKEVMYATATKQAMKEDHVEEGVTGAVAGGLAGGLAGGPLGALAGAYLGHKIQQGANSAKKLAKEKEKLRREEAEQIDELSKDTLASYAKKATKDARITQSIGKDFEASANKSRKPSMKDAAQSLADKYKSKSRSREAGIGKAIDRLAKEEVEQIDEKSDQAKRNKIMKNVMAASKGAQINRTLKLDPTEYGYKRAQHLNVAIGRQMMKAEEVKKDDVPFDGPYTKTKPAKNSDGTTQSPMSRARALAKDAIKKQMKEDIDRLFEKDDNEYNYEGEMAVTQLKTIMRHAEALQAKMQPDTNLPEWVQSKITLAADYIQTASDYLHSEIEEQAPVAPVPDKKYIKGTPEHKAYKATKKPINGMPTNVKESFDADGNIINNKVSYKEFAMMLEYEAKDGVYRHKGTYGGSYVDPEGADDADDKKPKQQPAVKRGRGRPAGAKSGAGKITGTSKLYK
jgi:hypothetical protein